jgi:hypothetical protein
MIAGAVSGFMGTRRDRRAIDRAHLPARGGGANPGTLAAFFVVVVMSIGALAAVKVRDPEVWLGVLPLPARCWPGCRITRRGGSMSAHPPAVLAVSEGRWR